MGIKRLARMSTGGRITVPKAILDATGIRPGDYLLLHQVNDNEALVMKADPRSTQEELDQLVQKALAVRSTLRTED